MSDFVGIAVLVFAVSSMAAVGREHTLSQIVDPLRHPPNVARALAANFVLVPLLGRAIITVFPLEQPLGIGLFLVATVAGAPFPTSSCQMDSGGPTHGPRHPPRNFARSGSSIRRPDIL